jgi:hypothetical protein
MPMPNDEELASSEQIGNFAIDRFAPLSIRNAYLAGLRRAIRMVQISLKHDSTPKLIHSMLMSILCEEGGEMPPGGDL